MTLMTLTNLKKSPRTLAVGSAALALAAVLSACGGGGTNASTGNTSTTVGNPAGSTGSGAGGGFPGASGSVAAISGTSMEVQNTQSGQVTVSWTSSTTFSKTVTLTAAGVAVGDCVTVTGSNSTGSLTATSVTVSQPSSSGSCTNALGAGGRSGGFPGGAPPSGGSGGTLPSRPSGSFPGGGSGFAFASGKVTSVSSTGLVIYGVSSSGFTGTGGSGGQGSTPTSIPSTSVNVALSSSTRYTESQSTSASSLAVGDCVTANGSTSSSGAVTARTIRITSTGGQTCSTGFAPAGGTANG